MTYEPNVPSLSVTDQLVLDNINEVFLAEFSPNSGVREVLMDPTSAVAPDESPLSGEESSDESVKDILASESFPTRPVATAAGIRLHRVISPAREVVAQYDAERDMTPMDFLGESGAVVAVAQPGETYTWKLVQIGPTSSDGNVAPIIAMRPANASETAQLDEMYPGWLEACRKFDAEAQATSRSDESPGLPPPVFPQ